MSHGLVPGDEVDGRYRLERRLGSGGMGEVFAALDLKREQRVALKVFRQTTMAREIARERLLREGRAASRVAHPHIVRVHEVGAGETAYLTMELLEGEDLGARMDREGALPIGFCEQLARELAEALIAMHEAGVVHRDLKPKNVFLLRDGRCKVLDFGLAKAEFLGESLTEAQQVFGTLNYLAPEQLRSATLADARSDLWAFGTVMFEALTGYPAFPGRDAPQVVTSISTLDAVPVGNLRADAPPYLAELVRRTLQRDPTLRFQSARELLAALDARHVPARDALTTSLTAIVAEPREQAPEPRAPWMGPLLAAKVVGISLWLMHADATNAERRDEPETPVRVAWPVRESAPVPLPPPAEPAREPVKPVPKPRRARPAAVVTPEVVPSPEAPPAPSAAGTLRRSEF